MIRFDSFRFPLSAISKGQPNVVCHRKMLDMIDVLLHIVSCEVRCAHSVANCDGFWTVGSSECAHSLRYRHSLHANFDSVSSHAPPARVAMDHPAARSTHWFVIYLCVCWRNENAANLHEPNSRCTIIKSVCAWFTDSAPRTQIHYASTKRHTQKRRSMFYFFVAVWHLKL